MSKKKNDELSKQDDRQVEWLHRPYVLTRLVSFLISNDSRLEGHNINCWPAIVTLESLSVLSTVEEESSTLTTSPEEAGLRVPPRESRVPHDCTFSQDTGGLPLFPCPTMWLTVRKMSVSCKRNQSQIQKLVRNNFLSHFKKAKENDRISFCSFVWNGRKILLTFSGDVCQEKQTYLKHNLMWVTPKSLFNLVS